MKCGLCSKLLAPWEWPTDKRDLPLCDACARQNTPMIFLATFSLAAVALMFYAVCAMIPTPAKDKS